MTYRLRKQLCIFGAGLLALFFTLLMAIGGLLPPAAAFTNGQVTTYSTSDKLSSADQELLAQKTAELQLPGVKHVSYLLFDTNLDNLNDTVLQYAQTQQPTLLNSSQNKWAPGELIIAVGLNPRRVGMYCGDDVCAGLQLEGDRLEELLESMKPALRRDNPNYAAAMLIGATNAGDLTYGKMSPETKIALGCGIAGVVGLAGGGLYYAARKRKQQKIATAQQQYATIKNDYTDLALRLDETDLRAHNLNSPLADQQLRAQWQQVHKNFLSVQSKLDKLEPWAAQGDWLTIAPQLNNLAEIMTDAKTAADNIDTLFDLERGDTHTRRLTQEDLLTDLAKARAGCKRNANKQQVKELEQQAQALDPASPDFVADYALLLDRFQQVIATIQESEFKEVKQQEHQRPTLTSTDWRPGYGYNDFLPYWLLWNWHQSDISAANSSSTTSFNSGFSSSSFSGGGGSSSF